MAKAFTVIDSESFRPRTFADPAWDWGEPALIEAALMRMYAAQVKHAVARNEFWGERLRHLPASGAFTRSEIESIPLLTKSEMRLLKPFDLVADGSEPFHMVRGTGGTTGAPVPLFWTTDDWRAAQEALARWLEPLVALRPLRVFNAYNQAHVSGSSFDDAIRRLGGTPIPRHFRSTEAEAVHDILRFGANALVITPKSGSGKGGSLEDFLAIDPDFLRKGKVKALIVSSTPLDRDFVVELKAQGIETIVNFYGSTEALPDGASCQSDPTAFHLTQGPNLVEVVDGSGRHVRSGERGLVAASRIGSSSGSAASAAQGTQLFRLVVGDEATYVDEPCNCGRRSPRLRDIQRVLDVEAKLSGGCEKWD